MKNGILGLILILGISFSSFGQNLGEYRYVSVPDKFEFQKSENQYKLNALTAFLFEKYGFEPIYRMRVPAGTDPCSIVEADVIDDSGFFTTKVYVTLTNCRNELVFTSQTGASKEKDYQKAYHEALREAFKSIEALEHKYEELPAEVIIDPVVSANERSNVSPDPIEDIEVIVDPVVSAEERDALKNEINRENAEKASSEDTYYVNGSEVYKLSKSPSGFDFLKEASQEKWAELVRSNGGEYYHFSSEKMKGIAFFDGNGSLVVEYIEPVAGQLVTLIFRKRN